MHPLPSSKSSSSTAIERKNNTRSTWLRWIQTGSRFLTNCRAPLRGSKILHKLRTSPALLSSTRASPQMNARFKISNQSSSAIRAASRQSERSWTILPTEQTTCSQNKEAAIGFHSLTNGRNFNARLPLLCPAREQSKSRITPDSLID